MSILHLSWRQLMAVLVLALALGGASAAQAQDSAPVVVESNGQAAIDPGTDTVNADDYYLYLSAPAGATVGGVAYADEDILRYDASGGGVWVKVFDGTNAGLPASADIDALAYQPVELGSSYYMSFDTPVNVPGLGLVDDSDVVAYTTILLQGGTWTLYFDGSAHGLAADSEDIDALEKVAANEFAFSTTGAVTVPGYYQPELTAKDEDVLVYNGPSGKFIMNFAGALNGLKGKNNITGTASTYSGNADLHFYSVKRQGTFVSSQSSLTAAPNDIVVREQTIVVDRYTLFFDASAAGFPKVDAFDVVHK